MLGAPMGSRRRPWDASGARERNKAYGSHK